MSAVSRACVETHSINARAAQFDTSDAIFRLMRQ
jgi:hypothetical protein